MPLNIHEDFVFILTCIRDGMLLNIDVDFMFILIRDGMLLNIHVDIVSTECILI